MKSGFVLALTEASSGWVRGVVTLADQRLKVRASWFEDTAKQLCCRSHACLVGHEARVIWV